MTGSSIAIGCQQAAPYFKFYANSRLEVQITHLPKFAIPLWAGVTLAGFSPEGSRVHGQLRWQNTRDASALKRLSMTPA